MSSSTEQPLDYAAVIAKYPWIIERDQDCILSPDSDGLLCGLLMSHYLGWKIRGFYDGKVLAVQRGTDPKKCVFLDMEICRKDIRSVGQHMVMYDKRGTEWVDFDNCISANNLRGFDFRIDFKSKYPLATVHLLMALLSRKHKIKIAKNAVSVLLYTDGTFKNQFNYPENVLSWLTYLGVQEESNPLHSVFMDPHYSTYELMVELRELFARIRLVGDGKRGGDKIKISDSRGNLINFDPGSGMMAPETTKQAKVFLDVLSEKTGWTMNENSWPAGPFEILLFEKGSTIPTGARYRELLAKKPISLAIISAQDIEYTLDPQGHL